MLRKSLLALCLVTSCGLLAPAPVIPGAEKMPPGFVDVSTVVPSARMEIRYYGEHNFVGRPVDGYRAPKCLLTRQAAEALAKVQADLAPFSLTLKMYDGYRPQAAVDHFVRWAKDIGDVRTKKEF